MYFIIKGFDSNHNLIIESIKVYSCDLNKFTDFIILCKTKITLEITNYNDKYDITTEEINNTTEEINDDMIFKNMNIEKYGKGYILTCADDHYDYGTKYYHNAWWFSNLNSWFFKKEFLNDFINNGAKLIN